MSAKNTLTDYEKLRKSAILYRETHTLEETARVFMKTPKTIVSWCQQYKEKGTLTKAPRGGKTHCIVNEEGERFIIATVEKENDLTLAKIRQYYLAQFGIKIGLSTVDYYLRKNNLTLKKKSFYDPKQKETTTTIKRLEFIKTLESIPEEDRYFLDETGSCLNMTRTVARSPKNKKAFAERPTSQGKHLTTVGIMNKKTMIFEHTFEGFLNKEKFIALLKSDIIGLFKNTSKYLILDNAPAHKSPEVIALLDEHKINYLYLPPYSPDFNPIELAWSKLKNFIRAVCPRSVFSLDFTIFLGLQLISKQDIEGYFRHVNRNYLSLS
jgi:transposase